MIEEAAVRGGCQIQGERSGSSDMIEVDLSSASCGNGFTDVRMINGFVSTGTAYRDSVRVQ